MKKVLVLGGGFAGLETAIFLRKQHFEVTLVSDRDYFFITPISIWLPVHKVAFETLCVPLNELQEVHGFETVVDKVVHIRAKDGAVELDSGKVLRDYDFTVIAMGASKVPHEGVEHTKTICGKPEQTLQLRDRVDELLKRGSGKIAMGFGGNPKDMSAVRGGPAFEMLFNVEYLLRQKGLRKHFELTMFAPMEEPGKRLGDKALKTMGERFKKLGIGTRFGKKIKRFETEGVVFEDDSRLEADLTMFIPAGRGHEVVQRSDLPLNEAGFILIDDHCKVQFEGEDAPENIFAVGDCAALQGPQWRAKQGHMAEVMARNAAFNITAQSRGQSERQGYAEHLSIMCVMDSGDGASMVYRDAKRGMMIPMPIVGHWLKKAWGRYCRLSKLEKVRRLPGM